MPLTGYRSSNHPQQVARRGANPEVDNRATHPDEFTKISDRAGGVRVVFLPGRMRFIRRGQTDVGPNERPPFGCCLLIWGPHDRLA